MDLDIRLRSVGSLTNFIAENRTQRFRNAFQVRVRHWPNNGQAEGTPTTIVNPDFSGSVLRVPLPSASPGEVIGIAIDIVPRSRRGGNAQFISSGRIEITNDNGVEVATLLGNALDDTLRINMYFVSDWLNTLTTFRNDQVTADEQDLSLLGLAYGFPNLLRFHKRMWERLGEDLPAIIDEIDDVSWTNADGKLSDKWATATYAVDVGRNQVAYRIRILKPGGRLYGTCRFGVQFRPTGFPVEVPLHRVGFEVDRPAGARIRSERKTRLRETIDRFVANLGSFIGSDRRSIYSTAASSISAERVERGFAGSVFTTVNYANMSSSVVPSWQEGRSITPITAHRPVYRGGFTTIEPAVLNASFTGHLRRV